MRWAEAVVEADPDGDAAGVVGLHAAEEGLVFGLAGAERDQVEVLGDDLGRDFGQDVGAFLAGKAGDDADQRTVDGLVGQAEFAEQLGLADALAGEVVAGVAGGKVRVDVGAPFAVVDAVEDAGEHMGAVAQGAIEAEAVLGRLDLARVGRADGVEGVGEGDAGLDVADPAVEFQAAGVVEGRVERGVGERGTGEESLVAEIVDGEEGAARRRRSGRSRRWSGGRRGRVRTASRGSGGCRCGKR